MFMFFNFFEAERMGGSSNLSMKSRLQTLKKILVLTCGAALILPFFVKDVEGHNGRHVDCECSCCGGDCELDASKHFIQVGDPSSCTKETCMTEEAACSDVAKVKAEYLDCQCSCCKGESCPTLTHNMTHAGAFHECTQSVCTREFPALCPVESLENHMEENFPTYLDCTCNCEDADGNDEYYARFFASSRLLCTEEACKQRLWRAPSCASDGTVNALYTGSGEDFSKVKRKLSEGAVVGISVSVTLAVFFMLGYGGYFAYQRKTGSSLRWIRFQEESDL